MSPKLNYDDLMCWLLCWFIDYESYESKCLGILLVFEINRRGTQNSDASLGLFCEARMNSPKFTLCRCVLSLTCSTREIGRNEVETETFLPDTSKKQGGTKDPSKLPDEKTWGGEREILRSLYPAGEIDRLTAGDTTDSHFTTLPVR